MNENNQAITVLNLTKKFNDFTAVDSISFSVKKGESGNNYIFSDLSILSLVQSEAIFSLKSRLNLLFQFNYF